GKNSLNRLIRCVCGKKIGPDPRNFNQRVSLGRNDLLIRTFPRQNWLLIVPHFMKHPSCYKIEKDMLSLIFLEAEQNYLEIER
ncbi:hypothetical protein QUH34_29640, partial [Klebsiella pneumoniae]|nr:hypothetical protein [Klebsiella pneumoniae]